MPNIQNAKIAPPILYGRRYRKKTSPSSAHGANQTLRGFCTFEDLYNGAEVIVFKDAANRQNGRNIIRVRSIPTSWNNDATM